MSSTLRDLVIGSGLEFEEAEALAAWQSLPSWVSGITRAFLSGHTYTTRPGSRLLFPTLCVSTGELPTVPTVERPTTDRGVMMPKLGRTREQDRIYRINAGRALNAAHVVERNQPPPF